MLDEDASRPFFQRALEAGINFFDTADMYSDGASEEVLGRALKRFAVHREHVVVATKVMSPMGPSPNQQGLSRKHIMHAIDNSLRRLQLDYVDLYQIHRFDYSTPIEETICALHDVVKAGKARYIGASSMHSWQFASYLHQAERLNMTRFVSMQNLWHLAYREEEREMVPLCRHEGVAITPWSPLARGFLGRAYAQARKQESPRSKTDRRYPIQFSEADMEILRRVEETAQKRGLGNAQIALAWLLHQPGVTAPIIGASKLSHLDDAIRTVDIRLSPEEIAYLGEPYQPKNVVSHT